MSKKRAEGSEAYWASFQNTKLHLKVFLNGSLPLNIECLLLYAGLFETFLVLSIPFRQMFDLVAQV